MQVLRREGVKFLFFAQKRRAVARLEGNIRKYRMVAVSRSSLGFKEFYVRTANSRGALTP